jgi:hypothetical protein
MEERLMSTRCNLVVRYGREDSLIFYRYCDGYPAGVARTLGEFVGRVRLDRIRRNVEQACGWLIVLGREEYLPHSDPGWNVGTWEPSVALHGDIEYLYEIDLRTATLRGWKYHRGEKGDDVTADLLAEIEKRKKPDIVVT